MKILRIIATCAIAITLIVGCTEQKGPTDPTELALTGPTAAVTANYRAPFAWSSWWCAGSDAEIIDMEGVDHWVEKYTETPSGRILDSFHTNYTATAVGRSSGYVWQVNGQWGHKINWDDIDGFPFVRNMYERIVLVGHGQTPNRIWQSNWHVTINAPGEVIVARFVTDEKCQ